MGFVGGRTAACHRLCQVRLRAKTKDTWRCAGCHSKTCTLRRTYGTWPTPGFAALAEEAKTDFFKSIADVEGLKLVKKSNELLEAFEERVESFSDR